MTRSRVLVLIRHVRARMAANLKIWPEDLARRFQLDPFMVRRLIEEEVGCEGAEAVDPRATRRETMEMGPADDSGLHSVLGSGQD